MDSWKKTSSHLDDHLPTNGVHPVVEPQMEYTSLNSNSHLDDHLPTVHPVVEQAQHWPDTQPWTEESDNDAEETKMEVTSSAMPHYNYGKKPMEYRNFLCYFLQPVPVMFLFKEPVLLVDMPTQDSVGLTDIAESDKIALTILVNEMVVSFHTKTPITIKTVLNINERGEMLFLKLNKQEVPVFANKDTKIGWEKLPKVFHCRAAIQFRGIKTDKITGQASFMKKMLQVKVVEDALPSGGAVKYLFE